MTTKNFNPDNNRFIEEKQEPITLPRTLHLEIDLYKIEKVSIILQQALRQDIQTEAEAAHDVEIADSLRQIIAEAIAQKAKANPKSICNLVQDVCIDWELTD